MNMGREQGIKYNSLGIQHEQLYRCWPSTRRAFEEEQVRRGNGELSVDMLSWKCL